jgi:hypothetical protein
LKAFVDACHSGKEDSETKCSKILAGLKDTSQGYKRIILREKFPTQFDEALKVGDIVELVPPAGEPGRWFGEVDSKTATGVNVKWYKIDWLEYDKQQPTLDFNEFRFIKGIVDL